MKRIIFLILMLSAAVALSASPSYSASLGGDFFNYEKAFLDMGASAVVPLNKGMEFNLGVNFGIATETEDGEVTATFYVPFDVGLNFVFNEESKMHFLVGTGVTPQLIFDEGTGFYMGPYFKGGVRVNVHQYMKWFLEVQQDLIIGAPKWINTASRIRTGLLFNLGN